MNQLSFENGPWKLTRLFYTRGRISTEIEIPDEWLFDYLQDHMPTNQDCIFENLPTGKHYNRNGQPINPREVISRFKRGKPKPEQNKQPASKKCWPAKRVDMKRLARARKRLLGEFQLFNEWLQSGGDRPRTSVLNAMLKAAQNDRASRKNITRWARLRVRYSGIWLNLNYRLDQNDKIWLVPPKNKIGLVEICESSM